MYEYAGEETGDLASRRNTPKLLALPCFLQLISDRLCQWVAEQESFCFLFPIITGKFPIF